MLKQFPTHSKTSIFIKLYSKHKINHFNIYEKKTLTDYKKIIHVIINHFLSVIFNALQKLSKK